MSQLRLVVRLWLRPEADLVQFEEFERQAGQVMKAHGGRIERAFRASTRSDAHEPFEVHLVSFPSEAAFNAYQSDERTKEFAPQRERLIERTEIWKGIEVNYGF